MISRIRGTLLSSAPSCVVNVGGVGFEILVTEKDRALLARSSGEVAFYTYLHVREDRIALYGFLRSDDRELFTRLIDVSGIGPRTALGIMAEEPAARIVGAIRNEDNAFLCHLPGLGRKTAERLILELKDKLADLATERAETEPITALREEAILALTSLGMARQAAQRALERVDWSSTDATNLEAVIKEALKHAGSI